MAKRLSKIEHMIKILTFTTARIHFQEKSKKTKKLHIKTENFMSTPWLVTYGKEFRHCRKILTAF